MQLTDITCTRLSGTDYVFSLAGGNVYRLYNATDIHDIKFVGCFPSNDSMWRHVKAAFDE